MGVVMIKCPHTGRDLATGIVADRASFNATPVFFSRVYCPMCRVEHEWFAQEAWVCDGSPWDDAPDGERSDATRRESEVLAQAV